jgi:hypothetical protein
LCGGSFWGTIYVLSGGGPYVTGVFAAASGSDGSTAAAYVDPYFSIDPTWAAQNAGYSLIFSPGIGNSLPTPGPQPSTFGALAFGFIGLASLRQRLKSRLRG